MSGMMRFFAPTSREALRQLKETLGADALVLRNQTVEGGVEIWAMPPEAIANAPIATAQPAPKKEPQPAPRAPFVPPLETDMGDFRVTLSSKAPPPAPPSPPPPPPPQPPRPSPMVSLRQAEAYVEDDLSSPWQAPKMQAPPPEPPRRHNALFSDELTQPRYSPADINPAESAALSAAASARMQALEEANSRMAAELSSIRGLLEKQLAGFAWGNLSNSAPTKAELMGELLEAGLSAELSRKLVERVSPNAPIQEARNRIHALMNANLRVMLPEDDLVDQGGVFALIGPTGVGKTTTTAKLAARCVVRHGASRLALVTSDGYRIGAHEQLRIYGRILGVPVLTVRDTADLRQTLAELRGKHMVLIDTVGMSQRDDMVADQHAMLNGSPEVRRLLVLNSTSRGDTLDDVVRTYKNEHTVGCILSKLDEAASLGPAIDVAVRHKLRICYVANGQRVPEDLHLPNLSYLIHRALRRAPDGSPFRMGTEEAGMMLTAGSGV